MLYRVLFESSLSEDPTREVVRLLESLPLRVVPVDDPAGSESDRCPSVPVVTLGGCPKQLVTWQDFRPREWIAILPAGEGSTSSFVDAGAFAVLRLPVERSELLSTVSRCLCVADGTVPEQGRCAPRRPRRTRKHAVYG